MKRKTMKVHEGGTHKIDPKTLKEEKADGADPKKRPSSEG